MKEIREKGITLIALVVTIIILLILAGVTISSVISNEGLFARANKATVAYVHETVKEAMNLQYTDYIAEKVEQNNSKTLISYLQGKKIIGEEESGKYRINVEKLLGGRQSLGNGTGDTDVYKLEDITEELKAGEVTLKETAKVATTEPIKIADESGSSEKTYRLMYYGKTESENKELDIFKDENSSEKISFTIDFNGEIQEKYYINSGASWSEFTKENSNFYEIRLYGEGIYTYLHAEIIDMEGSANHWQICDDEECEDPVYPDEIIKSKTYYTAFIPAECVYPNSNILISKEGKTIQAKDIREGNDIAYYNFETKEVEIGTVEKAYIHKDASNFVRYTFEDGSYLEATDYHPIYTKEGWRSYTRRNGYDIPKIGDEVKTEKGWKRLSKIESFEGKEDCYDFVVRGKNGEIVKNYFANGTLVQGSY